MEGLTLSGLNSVDCSLKGKCSLVWVCCAFDRFWSWYIHNAILKVLTENCWNWRYCVVKIQCSKDNCKYWLWCTAKWWIDLLDFASFWLLYRLWNSIAKRKRTKRKTYMLEWMTFFHWPTSDLQIELKCLILTTGKSFYVCVCVHKCEWKLKHDRCMYIMTVFLMRNHFTQTSNGIDVSALRTGTAQILLKATRCEMTKILLPDPPGIIRDWGCSLLSTHAPPAQKRCLTSKADLIPGENSGQTLLVTRT